MKLEGNTGDRGSWREGNGDRTDKSIYTGMEFPNQQK